MSHSTVQVLHVNTPAMPRGSSLIAALYQSVASLFRSTPKAGATRAEEAAAVRDMARRLQQTDPSFAADLYAAAARHEMDDEVSAR